MTVLEENPNIEFMLYFPPISHYAYAVYGNKKFWLQMLMRKETLGRNAEHEKRARLWLRS